MKAKPVLKEHIDESLLPKLPVKTLLQFTTVSKHWHSTILHNPRFAKLQLQSATKSRRILVSSDDFPDDFKSLNMESSWFGGSPLCCRTLHLPFREGLPPPFKWDLLGSCNGLVFLSVRDGVVFSVWNPTTRFYRRLPDITHSPDVVAKLIYYGVGYLKDEDDYRVVLGYKVQGVGAAVEMVHVFSTREYGWRIIANPDFVASFVPKKNGTFSNQALHWRHRRSPRCYTVAFDMRQERFRSMEMPEIGADDHDLFKWRLGVVGGCLCVSVCKGDADTCQSVDFWVMREYGTWTRDYTLDFSYLPADPLLREQKCRWFAWESGTFTLKGGRDGWWLVRIDREEEEKLGLYMISSDEYYNMIEYEESLIQIEGKENVENVEKTETSSPEREEGLFPGSDFCVGSSSGAS